jgi:hypothetical protein
VLVKESHLIDILVVLLGEVRGMEGK